MEQQEIVISLPLYLLLSKKEGGKKYYINLNQYRNWHFQVSNNLKRKYSQIVSSLLPPNLSFKNKIELTFTLWKRDKRRQDRANPLSIHEKFFCDALVSTGAIPDDNDTFITSTHYYTGGIDRENPRVEIRIRECLEEES